MPDILFRMPIKDNVTCKMCKLLLALHLSSFLCPYSEFVLTLKWTETQEKRAPGQEHHRQTLKSKSIVEGDHQWQRCWELTALPPAPFTVVVVPGKLWHSWIEVWIKLYLSGFLTSMSNMGQVWEKMRETRLGERKHSQQSRADPLCEIQVWEHSNGLCLSQREPFQLPHTRA